MHFDVFFRDGTSSRVDLSPRSTVRVISPDDNVSDAFGLNDVIAIDFHQHEPQPAAEPLPVAEVLEALENPQSTVDPEQAAHDDLIAQLEREAVDVAMLNGDEKTERISNLIALVGAAQARWPESERLLELGSQFEAAA